jgi:DNA-binding response OmpR family regulator
MTPKSVLIVDDEPTVREVVGHYLERDGFSVRLASDGEEALRSLGKEALALIVLDLMLPKINGEEICRRVRAESDVPIIMLKARGREPDRLLGLQLGADDYVVKPFSPRELVARVHAVLRRSRPQPAAARRWPPFDRQSRDRSSGAQCASQWRARGTDCQGVRPAALPHATPWASVQPRATAGRRLGLGLRG